MTNEERDELLVRIDERVNEIRADLKDGRRRMDGHGVRLDALEKWRNRIVGALTVLAGLLGWKLT